MFTFRGLTPLCAILLIPCLFPSHGVAGNFTVVVPVRLQNIPDKSTYWPSAVEDVSIYCEVIGVKSGNLEFQLFSKKQSMTLQNGRFTGSLPISVDEPFRTAGLDMNLFNYSRFKYRCNLTFYQVPFTYTTESPGGVERTSTFITNSSPSNCRANVVEYCTPRPGSLLVELVAGEFADSGSVPTASPRNAPFPPVKGISPATGGTPTRGAPPQGAPGILAPAPLQRQAPIR